MGGTVHFRTCNVCEAMCGMRVAVEDNRVVEIRGDRDDVFSRGHICPKGPAMRELQEDPDRLRFPLRRTAAGFVRVSWDEALAEAGERLAALQRAHGPDAVAMYLGNPTAHGHGAILGANLLGMALGTKNRFDSNSQDANPRIYAALQMFGDATSLTIPDIDRTDYFLVFGANPAASGGSIMTLGDVRSRLAGVRERGGKFILFDPRKTETAAYADEHHFIRPGSDAALLLGMLHVIFAENLYDNGALTDLADGVAELRAIAARFPPERIEGPTGIPAHDVRRIAREFARTPRAVAYGRMGLSTSAFGPLSSFLVDALNIVTGHFDRPGGAMFTTPAADVVRIARILGMGGHGRFRSRVRGLPEVGGNLPATTMAEEMETPGAGQIRGLVVVAGNPVLSVPNGERIGRALSNLDFMVAVDIYQNETTRHAHLILPPRYALERSHYDLLFHTLAVRNTAKWSAPVIEAPPDTKDDAEILVGLAASLLGKRLSPSPLGAAAERLLGLLNRLGADGLLDVLLRAGPYGDRFLPFSKGLTLEKLKKAEHGIDLGALRPMFRERVRTKTGKARLAPPEILADVPRLERFLDEATAAGLVLIGRRHMRNNNSWMHNVPSLVKGPDRSMLLVHPTDAARLGLTSGARVRVRSRVGEVVVAMAVTEDMMPGVVSLPHGHGHAAAADTMRVAAGVPGANANAITDDLYVEPLTGTAILNGVPVTVEAADAAPPP
ncbi:molybdopterin-dependent oxidoreductase [Polyangium mundeleinium]|uniref:Molybdopterin-dependent oxidoreductase n=1 Tax=Polyangium mundeleinium TaxID=2995306 RepID=A0ABT5EUT1_9BACT|nr:molybdopterin-dependent oxidoreductase [Polyangium mundeleinium]MDC0745583.1 molybdopterin-dependent oxidoreductase [Polyangium mundeleinium]